MAKDPKPMAGELEAKEGASRGYYFSYYKTMLAVILLLAAFLGAGAWLIRLPRYVSCRVYSVSQEMGMATVRGGIPEDTQVKVELQDKSAESAGLWQALSGRLLQQGSGEKRVVDARLVIANINGSASVYFDAPDSAYTVTRVYYFGEGENLFQLLFH